MRVEPVNERDSSWEDDHPRFRVYIFRFENDDPGHLPIGTFSTDTSDLTECEVVDAIAWAESQVGPKDLYAVALVGEHNGYEKRRGLSWLVGGDDVYAGDHYLATDAFRAERLARMIARRDLQIEP